MNNAPVTLRLEDVRFGFPTRPDFLGPISLTANAGEFWAIVGPNGAGKSTLLRLLAGLRRPSSGRVRLNDHPLSSLSARTRARTIAFMPQQTLVDVELSVRSLVLMGRFPHRSLALFESAEDYRIAEEAMIVTQTLSFADRRIGTLSGGEAQRVYLASALAQRPRLLLLDEPTAALDLRHQLAIFEILRKQAAHDGLCVIVVTHDVNLAARYCSKVLLLNEGKVAAMGEPSEVVNPQTLGPVYGVDLRRLGDSNDPKMQWVVPVGSSESGS